MRLIDADKLNKKRKFSFQTIGGCFPKSEWFFKVSDLLSAPTVDAVPVVRCRDCKHKGWVQEPCHGKSIDYCRVWECTLRDLESNFCSYGERKVADKSEVR